MWRSVAGVVVLSVVAVGAEPPPVRVPARPLSADEVARRDALANFGTARLRQKTDNTLAAAKHLEAAWKLDPTAVAPRRELVSVYADLGRDAAAIRTARDVLKADPHDADTAHRLAKLLFEVKRYAEAADVLAAAVDSPRLATRATKKLAMRTDLARCRDRANDASAPAAWLAVRELLRTGEDQLMKEGFKPAEIAHEAATAAERHGRALAAAKQFDAAADAFRTARDLYADAKRANDRAGVARTQWNLAELFAAKGDAAAAVTHLEAYLAFKPRDAATYERYAEQLRKAGRDAVAKLRAVSYDGPPAAKWVLLAELARTPAGFGEAHVAFAELAKQTADADFFRILVRVYAAADTGSGLLDIADSLFPPTDERRKPTVSPDDSARRQAFANALVASPTTAKKVARAARLGGGTRRSAELWDLLAWACERDHQPDGADEVEAVLRAALQSTPEDRGLRPFQRLYHHLTARRKWDAVLALCGEQQGTLGTKLVNFYRGLPLAELGHDADALKALADAQKDNAFLAQREKLHVLEILGRYDDMLKECDAAMAEFKTPAEIHSLRYQRAQAYLGLKRVADAEAELRGLLEDDPDDVLALNNLGYNLAEQNRKLDDAERMVRRAIEIDADERAKAGEPSSDHAAYLDSLAWVLFRKGKLKESRELLEKAVTLADGRTDPTVWDHLGDAAFRLGDATRAKEAWGVAAEQYATTHMGRQAGRRDEVLRKITRAE